MNRNLYIVAILLLYSHFLLGQKVEQGKANALIITNLNRTGYHNGDTLSIKIKNTSSSKRGFTVEAIGLSNQLISYYHSSVYSAYLNNDSSFFRKLRAVKAGSKYILPDYKLIPYTIKGNTDTTIIYIFKGAPVKKAVLLKLRVTSDIINDDYEIVYSRPFYMFSLPK